MKMIIVQPIRDPLSNETIINILDNRVVYVIKQLNVFLYLTI